MAITRQQGVTSPDMTTAGGTDLTPYLITWGVCIVLGLIIGGAKGQAAGGAFLAILLGPLGVLIAVIMKPTVEIQAQRDVAVEQERERLRAEMSGTHTPQPGTTTPPTPGDWDGPTRHRS